MSGQKLDSVDAFLCSLEPMKARTLCRVIEAILTDFPELETRMAWNVPQICRGGDYVFGVSAAKSHLALAPWSSQVIEAFKPTLESQGYVVKKHLFQVPVDWQVDSALLRELVKARLAELA